MTSGSESVARPVAGEVAEEIVVRRSATRARSWSRARAEAALPALTAVVSVAGLSATQGGYFPSSWGLAALGLAWLVTVVLILRPTVRLERLELVAVLAVLGVTGWIALSALWSENVPGTVREVERALVYAAGVPAFLLTTRRRTVPALLAGLLGAILLVVGYGLGTRLFPTNPGDLTGFGGYRLAEPVGYWNGLGILAAMGIVLALGFAARGGTLVGRGLAASAVVVLSPALYFTFSRGAIVALLIGTAAAVIVDARRLQLVAVLAAVAPAPVIALWLSSEADGLTRAASTFEQARGDGAALAKLLVALMVLAGVSAVLFGLVERRFAPPRELRVAWATLLVAALAAGLVVTFDRYGNPVELVRNARESLESLPPVVTRGDPIGNRLFSLSSRGRVEHWRVAWREAREHPWTGTGAGTFQQHWFEQRPRGFGAATDAHSLYLEVLAELGPIGLALLGLALGTPLVAAVLARRSALTAGAAGAYVAFLAHAAVDWDWELTGVTLAALACGSGLLVAARRADAARPVPGPLRVAAGALALGLAVFAFVGHMGNRAIAASQRHYDTEAYVAAEAEARQAIRFAPWSSEAWQALGDAQIGLGDLDAAEAAYRKALAKNTRSWTAWHDLGNVTSGATRRRAYRRAAALNPYSPVIGVLRNRGELPKLPPATP